jgi:hypothetical protein
MDWVEDQDDVKKQLDKHFFRADFFEASHR